VFSAMSCFRSIAFSSTPRDAVTSRETGGIESAVCCSFGGLSIPRSRRRRRRKNQEVVEAHSRRRTYNAFLSSPSSSSMAAACNSPPPDYRANVGICLVNDKNEVIIFLLMMMIFFSVCVREGKSWFQTVLFPEISTVISYLFFQVLYTDLQISVYTHQSIFKFESLCL
jgi:hypothetical protein